MHGVRSWPSFRLAAVYTGRAIQFQMSYRILMTGQSTAFRMGNSPSGPDG